MKKEIKQRIERIKFSEIPDGYKKTKLGVMPIEWLEICWGNFIEEKINFTSDTDAYPLYSLTIKNGVIPKSERYERSHLVKKDEDTYKIVQKDDFVYNPMNIRFGAVAIYNEDIDVAVSGYYDIFKINLNANKTYLANLFKSKMMLNYFDLVATGSLVEKRRVHFSQLVSFKLPLPPLPEQEKISKILTTWDTAIALKEQYIKTLEARKTGLMQKLLLPLGNEQFAIGDVTIDKSKWKMIKMNKLFNRLTQKNIENNSNVLTISAQKGLISQRDFFNKEIASENKTSYYLMESGDFAYNKSYSNGYPFGAIKRLKYYEKGIVSPLYICFKPKDYENINYDYVEHFFDSGYINKGISQISQEGARNHGLLNIGVDDFFSIKIHIPSLPEQTAIASMLSLADLEISLQKAELETLKLQKKGLMQVLLTGKVRVAT